jgi:transcriptional regulator with XRE-family HTH domain
MGALNMEEKKLSRDGFLWAYNRYIGEDPKRIASFEEESFKAEVAQQLYDLRDQAGLTHEQLAERVETEASVIEDIEEADYEFEHLEAIFRIATLLGKKIEVRFVPSEKMSSSRSDDARDLPERANVGDVDLGEALLGSED